MDSLRSNSNCSFAWRIWAVDRSNEAIPTSSECLNEYGGISRIAQRVAQSFDGCIQAMIEVDERVRRPELDAQFLSAYHFSRSLQQGNQELKWLLLEFHLVTLLA